MSEPACDSELRRSDVSHGSPLACHQSSPDTDGFPDDTVTDTGRHSMSLQTAQALAQASSLAVFATMAIWYVAPWLNRRGRAAALAPLLWVHVFRYVALQTVSAQHAGFPISDGGRDEIISGDVAGAILAALAIVALRRRARWSIPLVWVLVAETAFDTVTNVMGGIRERLFGAASGVTWFILSFYVPVIIVRLGLLVCQLSTRRGEALTSSACTKQLSRTRREIVGLSPKRNEAESAAADIDRAGNRIE